MSADMFATASAYQPGSWYGVVGTHVTVLLPPSQKHRVPAIWTLVDDGAGFDEVLDALLATGLRELPGFVLVSDTEGSTKVVLRGAARARLHPSDAEPVELEGSSATTWVERSVGGVDRYELEVEPDLAGPEYTVAAGLVRVGSLRWPATASGGQSPGAVPQAAPAPETMAEPYPSAETMAEPDRAAEATTMDESMAGESELPGTPVAMVPDDQPPAPPGDPAGGPAPAWVPPPPPPPWPGAPEQFEEQPAEPVPIEQVPAEQWPAADAVSSGSPEWSAATEQGGDAIGESPEPAEAQPPQPWPTEPAEQWPAADAVSSGSPEWSAANEPEWSQPPAWQPDQWQPDSDATQVAGPAEPDQPAPIQPPSWGQPPSWDEPPIWAPAEDSTDEPPASPYQAESAPHDHDGLTQSVDWEPEPFMPPGIPGQEQAPRVTPAPVALLTFATGEQVEVDRVILIGRAPEARRFTADEQPRLVTVPSPNHEISATHLEVRPGSGADHGSAVVTDLASTNGSVLIQPGFSPENLQPGVPVQLNPGAVIDLGDGVTIQVTGP